ncbi:metal-sulfur cluster biosynthetic enzyme [Cytobacillus oceanisediminis]|jgi:metal-sulfur cluster biosynthetic enzyme|uniref:Metal-sulfur cluster biosynthetic enzyme n=1 Tax=Cytobacillus oceanisediminis TaxID=665099 RepID=A0A2V2ZHJ9_9BACI|nr:metal-sulfur cluster assembly factor [Cytobacillus oceanisediminis]PWW19435.1 metal-sulfur cluster biosynthetic enzyme [Cytobacillus oceanisediminis]
MSSQLKDKVFEALEEVIDPELGIDIVNLGLIYEVTIEEDKAHIVMTMTSMGCPLAGHIMAGVKASILENVEEFKTVNVDIVWSPPWTKERMSRYAQLALGVHS